jgi:hypothetical protein
MFQFRKRPFCQIRMQFGRAGFDETGATERALRTMGIGRSEGRCSREHHSYLPNHSHPMLDIRLANGLHAPRHTRGHWVDQNPIGNAFRTTSSHSAPSSASSNLAQSRLWLLLFLLEIFMSETRHKTYKRERNKRHSIQQPPGKRRQANHHLTHRITYLLTHQWIPSSPSSPSTPSPRPHPRLPPPSRLLTEAPSIASSLKRPFLVDRCLISLITGKCFCTLSSAALLIDARISLQYHSSFMTSLFSA